MNWKKTTVVLTLGLLLAAPSAMAAKAGIRLPRLSPKISRPAPKVAAPKAAPNTQASPNQKSYKPSQKAGDIKGTAPGTRANANPNLSQQARPATPWGGMMRRIGWLAGGMMLGGLLSHLFGFGATGFMAELLGLLMNGLIIWGVISLIRMAIGYFMGRKNQGRTEFQARRPESRGRTVDAEAYEEPVEDIRPPEDSFGAFGAGIDGYEAKSTADKYRRR